MGIPIKILRAATDNTIGQRLQLEMKKRGLTSAELAKRSGVKTSFLYDVMSGKSANPSTIRLARVAASLGISLAYLVGSTDHPDADAAMLANNDYITIPRIAVDVSAGGGAMVAETRELEGEHYYFRKSWIKKQLSAAPNDLRMLHVKGDSMEPTLCNNDIILVDTSKRTPSPSGIFVIFDGLGLVAKRLEYTVDRGKRRLRILSDNAQYSAYERSPEDASIIGRVVWFAREI